MWSPSTDVNDDLDDEISILVTLRLDGEQDEDIYDYSDLLQSMLENNLDAGGNLDEGDVVNIERYHASEKSNPTIFIELSGRIQ